MPLPAARVNDLHACPKIDPGPLPHVFGKIVEGAPTVKIAYEYAAREGDKADCFGVPSPAANPITEGEATVLICHKPAARLCHPMAHGGFIITGCPTVLIGSTSQGVALSAATKAGFADECEPNDGGSV